MKKTTSVLCIRQTVLAIFGNCLICLVGFWVFSFSDAYASTYYVRTDGNNSCSGMTDAAGSSGNCAFRNIQNGVNAAQAGDTVIVHTGTYSESPSSARSGSAGNLITLKAATGETVSITRFRVSHNYNVVQGFRITGMGASNVSSSGIGVTGNYNQLLYNTLVGNCQPWVGGEGACIAIFLAGSNNAVDHNIFDGVNNGANSSIAIGINMGGTTSNNIVTHNTFQNIETPGRLIVPQGTGHRIAHNEIKNCNANYTNAQVHPDVFQVFYDVSRNIIVEYNYVHNFGGQLGNIEGNSTPGNGLATGWTFRNNLFIDVGAALFIREYVTGFTFYNNTFVRSGTLNQTAIHGNYPGTVMTLKNNAFIACYTTGTGYGWYWKNAGSTADYNFVSHTMTGGTKTGFSETHGINGGNPLLDSSYKPQVGSVLINVGTDLSAIFTTDYAESIRTGSWDIGAYEYVGGESRIPLPPSGISIP